MIEYTSEPMVTTESAPPIQSIRPRCSALLGGTRITAATAATAAIGTLIRKVMLQE